MVALNMNPTLGFGLKFLLSKDLDKQLKGVMYLKRKEQMHYSNTSQFIGRILRSVQDMKVNSSTQVVTQNNTT